MKTTTIELTDTEVKTLSRALYALLNVDNASLQSDLYSDEDKMVLEKEIETCMNILIHC